MDQYTVEIQPDLIQRLARTEPIKAVSELIWNGLDADADDVRVEIDYDDLDTMSTIRVRDNGHGIPFDEAPDLFKRLGGSWKRRGAKTKKHHRLLHGYEGRGRYKAFSLGRVLEWQIVYDRPDGSRYSYAITILEANSRQFRISDEKPSKAKSTGVTVEISELDREFRVLEDEAATQHLAEILALYLKDYRNVAVYLQGTRIDPTESIASTGDYSLCPIADSEGKQYAVELEIIEWKKATQKALYLCSKDGFPLSRVLERRFHTADFQFSAYIKSEYIADLYEADQLELGEMVPALVESIEEAQKQIKEHFQLRSVELARSIVEEWKEERVYPYEGEAANPIERVERQVFDIVAVTANDYLPDFRSAPKKQKAMHLHMLRAALERSPDDLQLIIGEVLELPPRKRSELAKLLEDVSLTGIINAARMVSDRLRFLDGLDAILFDSESKERLKERSQLHRILAQETWIFGEEFHLTADDEGLTKILRKHAKMLQMDIAIDSPVRRVDGSVGIIDLMLSRSYRTHRPNETEHLVVELKAPKVTVGHEETNQIRSYAFAVAEDERFRSANTKWHFWVISNEMDAHAQREARQANLPPGVIYRSPEEDLTIWVKTWGQLLEENYSRLKFLKESLEHEADQEKGLKHLSERYKSYLEGVLTEGADALDSATE